ncbi:MAG: ABC transporter permease, partial [Oscillospiraceae bacterium]|nr:ABC transporter permease [Oscillospiraceae bacterium]
AAVAFYLNSIRDIEQGLLPTRAGRKTAPATLSSSTGLAVRLLRVTFIVWLLCVMLLAASYGSIMGQVDQFLTGTLGQVVESMPGNSAADQFVTMILSVISMCSVIPALTMVLKLRGEEKRGRLEQILAKPVSKTRLMTDYLLIGVVTAVVMQFAAVVSLWYASSSSMAAVGATPIAFGTVFAAGMAYLPAILVMVGLAAALIGFFPNQTSISWYYLGFSFFAVYLGRIMKLPNWFIRLSPFGNTPLLPTETNYVPLYIMSVIAVALIALAYVGYRKRDIQG